MGTVTEGARSIASRPSARVSGMSVHWSSHLACGAHAALAWAASCVLVSVRVLLSFADIRIFGAPSHRGNTVAGVS